MPRNNADFQNGVRANDKPFNLSDYDIVHGPSSWDQEHRSAKAVHKTTGEVIGELHWSPEYESIGSMDTKPGFKGLGVMTALVRSVNSKLGNPLYAPESVSNEGEAFTRSAINSGTLHPNPNGTWNGDENSEVHF